MSDARRAAVMSVCADGESNAAAAQRLSVHRPMVGVWRSRFAEMGPAVRVDEPALGPAGSGAG
jgi:transposase